ncbi:kinase-like domain-containing protein [Hypoxylon trugodes]|uniref:kinase-like domain-containing protein n=1 Tax=Hypoxylon trugodes TaxID=326681 RepID=UPI00219C5FEA|nr:kinase-like domain-containing protein [Hypoxylon trugodes]KAI1383041.1 kinase-like domain-containing protein [Hypoxylon trugodes]
MLKRFGNGAHSHIVTLLMTFKHGDNYHFIFPRAEYDLLYYFEAIPHPERSLKRVRWLAEQCLRITEAVHLIHFPPRADNTTSEGALFGRHGDIKSENILVFNDGNGTDVLVLSDFGLGSMHHDRSRSNVPNKGIPATPGFRPPECDMEGGTISRAFDIWSLGCLFLDILVWFLGGEDLRRQFEDARMTPHITGVNTPIYFEILSTESGNNRYRVKEEVIDWFAKMHSHPNCTHFVHEFLDLIERRMLLVESRNQLRARTPELLDQLKIFHEKCEGQNYQAYCLDQAPLKRLSSRVPQDC